MATIAGHYNPFSKSRTTSPKTRGR
jgi:hypothetical protein